MSFLSKLIGVKETKKPDIASILPQEIFDAGVLELKDIIAPSALSVTPKEINLGEKILRSFFVISYPRFLSDNWLSPIINLDKVFDVAIHVVPLETGEVMKGFQRKVAEAESQIMTREEKGLVRDPTLDVAYQDLEDLRTELTQAKEQWLDGQKMIEEGQMLVDMARKTFEAQALQNDVLKYQVTTLMISRVYIAPYVTYSKAKLLKEFTVEELEPCAEKKEATWQLRVNDLLKKKENKDG